MTVCFSSNTFGWSKAVELELDKLKKDIIHAASVRATLLNNDINGRIVLQSNELLVDDEIEKKINALIHCDPENILAVSKGQVKVTYDHVNNLEISLTKWFANYTNKEKTIPSFSIELYCKKVPLEYVEEKSFTEEEAKRLFTYHRYQLRDCTIRTVQDFSKRIYLDPEENEYYCVIPPEDKSKVSKDS